MRYKAHLKRTQFIRRNGLRSDYKKQQELDLDNENKEQLSKKMLVDRRYSLQVLQPLPTGQWTWNLPEQLSIPWVVVKLTLRLLLVVECKMCWSDWPLNILIWYSPDACKISGYVTLNQNSGNTMCKLIFTYGYWTISKFHSQIFKNYNNKIGTRHTDFLVKIYRKPSPCLIQSIIKDNYYL